MEEKRLKLRNGYELIGDPEITFGDQNPCLPDEKKLTDLITKCNPAEFFINIWGNLWAPEIGGFGKYHRGCKFRLGNFVFFFRDGCDLRRNYLIEEESIFTAEFFALLFRELGKTLDENWGEIELEKKQALLTWIEKEKRHLAGIETYNKIRGRLDNDREKNLANPEIIAALNNLAQALGILPKTVILYSLYDEASALAEKILLEAGIEYKMIQHLFSDTTKPVLAVDGDLWIGPGKIALYARGASAVITVNAKP